MCVYYHLYGHVLQIQYVRSYFHYHQYESIKRDLVDSRVDTQWW